MATIFTIGHSTRTLEELTEALKAHHIQTLVDIRAFPMSRRLPYFNHDSLAQTLPAAGIEYISEKRLGGRRRKLRDESPNTGLRNQSFRNYADYMLTKDFREAVHDLIARANQGNLAIMCAERVYFRCHRMLVSDWLTAHGHNVLHIDGTGPARPHKLMAEARLVGDEVIYNEGQLF